MKDIYHSHQRSCVCNAADVESHRHNRETKWRKSTRMTLNRPQTQLHRILSRTSVGNQARFTSTATTLKRQAKSCIWFCRRYGRDVLAFDVETEDIEKGSHSFKLQRFDNWWSRLGFYNIVGVRHVQVSQPCVHRKPMPHAADSVSPTCRSSSHSQ